MARLNSETEMLEAKAQETIDSFVLFYKENALSLPCRKVELTGRKSKNSKIISTLLGFELQIGKKRFSCPDMATALFLRIFSLIGSREVMVPLDPTRTADMVPELENRLNQIFKIITHLEDNDKRLARLLHNRLKSKIKNLVTR